MADPDETAAVAEDQDPNGTTADSPAEPVKAEPESDESSSPPPPPPPANVDEEQLQQADQTPNQDNNNSIKEEEKEDHHDAIKVNLSPSSTECYLSLRDTGRNFNQYYCLFCTATFRSVFEAYPHYSQHLDFNGPFVCACKNKYYDFDTFRNHHLKQHPESDDLQFNVVENEDIQLWVDDLLESQRKCQDRTNTLSCSCAYACHVCAKFVSHNVQLLPCTYHNEITFSEHVHSHFNLKSFLCKLCHQNGGKKYRIANINLDALNHLKTSHNFMAESPQQLVSAFQKIINIPLLEEQLTEAIVNRKLIEEKFSRIAQREASTLASRQPQRPKQIHVVPKLKVILKDKQLVVAPYSNVRTVRHEHKVLPKEQQLFNGQPLHIHIADGKVVNLPKLIHGLENRNVPLATPQLPRPPRLVENGSAGPLRIRDDQLKPRTAPERSQRQGTSLMAQTPPKHQTLVLKCQYCNMETGNRKLFTAHHLNKHPNLTVACTYSVK